jgi:hypothetical protein
MSFEKDRVEPTKMSSLDEKREIAAHIDLELDATQTPEWRAKERKIVRRLDMTLMPMVWCLYLFNYLDRNNIA